MLGLDFANHFKQDPLAYLTDLQRRYGDVVYIKVGPFHWYMLNHPDHVKAVLVTGAKLFAKTDLFKRVISSVDGNGLVVSEGDFWLRQRRIIQPAFHHEMLRHYANVMVSQTERCIANWNDGAKMDLVEEMTSLTLTIAARVFFSIDVASQALELGEAVTTMSKAMYREFTEVPPVPEWMPVPYKLEKHKAVNTVQRFIARAVEENRKSSQPRNDVLSMLIQARDVEGDGRGMSEEQIRSEAITLFNAGHDSTAAALSWTWYLLMKNRQVYDKYMSEVDSIVGANKIDLNLLAQLPLGLCIAKESLRLYPPAWVLPRQARENTELSGYKIVKGSLVNLVPFVMHRDERFFTNAQDFVPERFAAGNEEKIHPFAFFPFGMGPRSCIGKEFALMEMQLVMATITKHFYFELEDAKVEIEPNPLVSLEPKDGVKVIVRKRSAAS